MTVADDVAALEVASNMYRWCRAHCDHHVDAAWRSRITHDPRCPWLTRP